MRVTVEHDLECVLVVVNVGMMVVVFVKRDHQDRYTSNRPQQ